MILMCATVLGAWTHLPNRGMWTFMHLKKVVYWFSLTACKEERAFSFSVRILACH